MELLWFLLIGLIAGWLAGQIYAGQSFGIVGDIVVGIIGSLIGGFLFRALGIGTAYGLLGNIVMAVIGAIVLLALLRLIRQNNRPMHR